MSATYLNIDELIELSRRFDSVLKELPVLRYEMHEEIGKVVLGMVRDRIGGTGKVQRWQEAYVGTRGGYVAIRPKSECSYAKHPKSEVFDENGYAVGYVTNAIENGHVQKPGRYVPKLGRKLAEDYVAGRYFYSATRHNSVRMAQECAEEFARTLAEKLENE